MAETQPDHRVMHQTTIRFGANLWEQLQAAAAAEGVSVAQYVREAAIARVFYEAGREHDRMMARAHELSLLTRERAENLMEESTALMHQNELLRRRAEVLRTRRRPPSQAQ